MNPTPTFLKLLYMWENLLVIFTPTISKFNQLIIPLNGKSLTKGKS